MKYFSFNLRSGGTNIYASHINDIQNAIQELSYELENGIGTYAANKPVAYSSYTAGGMKKITFGAATASLASFNVPTASATPTTPASGDVWNDAGTLKFYNGSATKTIAFTDTAGSGNVTGPTDVPVNGEIALYTSQTQLRRFSGTAGFAKLSATGAVTTASIVSSDLPRDVSLTGNVTLNSDATNSNPSVVINGSASASGRIGNFKVYRGATLASEMLVLNTGTTDFHAYSVAGSNPDFRLFSHGATGQIKIIPANEAAGEAYRFAVDTSSTGTYGYFQFTEAKSNNAAGSSIKHFNGAGLAIDATAGFVKLGASSAVPVTISQSGQTTTVGGNLTVVGTTTLPTATSVGSVTSTEISCLSGVTSGIQSQINGKASTTHTHSNLSFSSPLTGGPYDGSVAVSVGLDTTSSGVTTPTNTQTLTNKSLSDSTTFIIDDVDPTKKAKFEATSIPTSTTNTYTFPSTGGTFTVLGNSTTGTANTKIVLDTSPTLITPILGVATATSVNKVQITAPTTSATLTLGDASTFSLAAAKTFTVNNSITLASAADGATLNIPSGSNTLTTTAFTALSDLVQISNTQTISGNKTFSGAVTLPSTTTYFGTTAGILKAATGTGALSVGTVAITEGGTGQTDRAAAINALLPSQTSNSGKYLTTNGTDASWATVAGGGATSLSGLSDVSITAAAAGDMLLYTTATGKFTDVEALSNVTLLFGDGINQISTGYQDVAVTIPFNCIITDWTIHQVGGVTITAPNAAWAMNLIRSTYTDYPAATSTLLNLTTLTLTTGVNKWTATGLSTAITQGDILRINVITSNVNLKLVALNLRLRRTS